MEGFFSRFMCSSNLKCGQPIDGRGTIRTAGLARSHAFTDGNKRTAWVTGRLFPADNGARLEFDPYDAIRLMESVAADKVSETELAAWLRSRLTSP